MKLRFPSLQNTSSVPSRAAFLPTYESPIYSSAASTPPFNRLNTCEFHHDQARNNTTFSYAESSPSVPFEFTSPGHADTTTVNVRHSPGDPIENSYEGAASSCLAGRRNRVYSVKKEHRQQRVPQQQRQWQSREEKPCFISRIFGSRVGSAERRYQSCTFGEQNQQQLQKNISGAVPDFVSQSRAPCATATAEENSNISRCARHKGELLYRRYSEPEFNILRNVVSSSSHNKTVQHPTQQLHNRRRDFPDALQSDANQGASQRSNLSPYFCRPRRPSPRATSAAVPAAVLASEPPEQQQQQNNTTPSLTAATQSLNVSPFTRAVRPSSHARKVAEGYARPCADSTPQQLHQERLLQQQLQQASEVSDHIGTSLDDGLTCAGATLPSILCVKNMLPASQQQAQYHPQQTHALIQQRPLLPPPLSLLETDSRIVQQTKNNGSNANVLQQIPFATANIACKAILPPSILSQTSGVVQTPHEGLHAQQQQQQHPLAFVSPSCFPAAQVNPLLTPRLQHCTAAGVAAARMPSPCAAVACSTVGGVSTNSSRLPRAVVDLQALQNFNTNLYLTEVYLFDSAKRLDLLTRRILHSMRIRAFSHMVLQHRYSIAKQIWDRKVAKEMEHLGRLKSRLEKSHQDFAAEASKKRSEAEKGPLELSAELLLIEEQQRESLAQQQESVDEQLLRVERHRQRRGAEEGHKRKESPHVDRESLRECSMQVVLGSLLLEHGTKRIFYENQKALSLFALRSNLLSRNDILHVAIKMIPRYLPPLWKQLSNKKQAELLHNEYSHIVEPTKMHLANLRDMYRIHRFDVHMRTKRLGHFYRRLLIHIRSFTILHCTMSSQRRRLLSEGFAKVRFYCWSMRAIEEEVAACTATFQRLLEGGQQQLANNTRDISDQHQQHGRLPCSDGSKQSQNPLGIFPSSNNSEQRQRQCIFSCSSRSEPHQEQQIFHYLPITLRGRGRSNSPAASPFCKRQPSLSAKEGMRCCCSASPCCCNSDRNISGKERAFSSVTLRKTPPQTAACAAVEAQDISGIFIRRFSDGSPVFIHNSSCGDNRGHHSNSNRCKQPLSSETIETSDGRNGFARSSPRERSLSLSQFSKSTCSLQVPHIAAAGRSLSEPSVFSSMQGTHAARPSSLQSEEETDSGCGMLRLEGTRVEDLVCSKTPQLKRNKHQPAAAAFTKIAIHSQPASPLLSPRPHSLARPCLAHHTCNAAAYAAAATPSREQQLNASVSSLLQHEEQQQQSPKNEEEWEENQIQSKEGGEETGRDIPQHTGTAEPELLRRSFIDGRQHTEGERKGSSTAEDRSSKADAMDAAAAATFRPRSASQQQQQQIETVELKRKRPPKDEYVDAAAEEDAFAVQGRTECSAGAVEKRSAQHGQRIEKNVTAAADNFSSTSSSFFSAAARQVADYVSARPSADDFLPNGLPRPRPIDPNLHSSAAADASLCGTESEQKAARILSGQTCSSTAAAPVATPYLAGTSGLLQTGSRGEPLVPVTITFKREKCSIWDKPRNAEENIHAKVHVVGRSWPPAS